MPNKRFVVPVWGLLKPCSGQRSDPQRAQLMLLLLLLTRENRAICGLGWFYTAMFRRRLESKRPSHANKLRTAGLWEGNPSKPAPVGGMLSDGRQGGAASSSKSLWLTARPTEHWQMRTIVASDVTCFDEAALQYDTTDKECLRTLIRLYDRILTL